MIALPSSKIPIYPDNFKFTSEGTKIIIDAADWVKLNGKICFDTGYYNDEIAKKLDECAGILQLKKEKQ